MKKVVHVVEAFASGIFTFLTELCNSSSEIYEITIIHSTRLETPENFESCFNKDIKLLQLDMCRGLDPVKNIKSFYKLYSIIKEINPDIVHLHSSKAGFLGRTVCFMLRYNMDNVYYNPHGFSFLQVNEARLKLGIFFLLERFAAALGGWTVACSKGEYLEALKISKRCLNINNGVDTDELDKAIDQEALKKTGNKIKIGTLGRICHQKNPYLFNNIAGNFPQYDFIWIGDGELRNKLTSGNITVTGWMDRKDALGELAGINIFILTSLWEGMPVSLLEAMYFGKPVVVSNIPGSRDIVQHGINGYVAGELQDYLQLIRLINEKGVFYFEDVRAFIFNHYNKWKMVQCYLDLYEKKSG